MISKRLSFQINVSNLFLFFYIGLFLCFNLYVLFEFTKLVEIKTVTNSIRIRIESVARTTIINSILSSFQCRCHHSDSHNLCFFFAEKQTNIGIESLLLSLSSLLLKSKERMNFFNRTLTSCRIKTI